MESCKGVGTEPLFAKMTVQLLLFVFLVWLRSFNWLYFVFSLFCSVYLFEVTKVAITGWKVQVVSMTYFFFFIVLWHVCKAKADQVKWSHGSCLKILKVKWFLNSKSWKSVWLKLYFYCMWCYKYSFTSWWFSIICGGLLGRRKNPSGCVECVSPSCITQAGLHINTSHQSNDAQCWLWLESVGYNSQFWQVLILCKC